MKRNSWFVFSIFFLVVAASLYATPLPSATLGEDYTYHLGFPFGSYLTVAEGNVLPPGLELTPSGRLEGVPEEIGTYAFIVRTTFEDGGEDLRDFQLTIFAEPLRIATPDLPGVLFDEEYEHQMLGTGGSGNYLWTVEEGELPPEFTLNPETGILSGAWDLLKPDLDKYPITVKLTDNEYAVNPARKEFVLKPDFDSYGWKVYRNGGVHVSESMEVGEYCLIYFHGTGLQIYFGTANSDLSLPESVAIDGAAVEPEAVLDSTDELDDWTATDRTIWTRYILADDLEEKAHVARIESPANGKKLVFETFYVQKGEGSEKYFVHLDATPDFVLYRGPENKMNPPETWVAPKVLLSGNYFGLNSLPLLELEDDPEEVEDEPATTPANTVDDAEAEGVTPAENTEETTDEVAAYRRKSSTGAIPCFRLYRNGTHVKTLFPNEKGLFPLPAEGTLGELYLAKPDNPFVSMQTPKLSAHELRQGSMVASDSGSNMTSGGGCLFR